ncbi:LamG-like jellyroll fold domain-containing protein [Halobacteriovorax sp. YZS-1-1]|uniref:LamG-like jellyroll fold domain-containing protein n=1 Tax=unclassified Halobacteriovorax TaxID=2639665 RepID=UPI00399C22C3
MIIFLFTGCSDPLKGRIDINSITEYDKVPPEIDFVTTAGPMNGNNDFTLSYTLTDDNSGVASAKILYTPDFNTTNYSEVTTVTGSSNQIKFCVPNKNHPAPAFKIIARDEAGNVFEKELGTSGPNFSINLDTDPTIPNLTSSLGTLTKDQPTTLNIDSCSLNACSGDAVYFEPPTQTKYVFANTTGTTPSVGDAWVSCETALSSGYLQNNFPSEGLNTYYLWTKTEDVDADSVTPLNFISSANTTIDITYDNTAPIDNTGTGFTFDNDVEIVGDNIPVQWSLFTDQQVVDHRIELYTDNTCNPLNLYNSYTTSSAAITDNTNVDGLVDGQYWAKVIAIDHVGLEGSSSCSLDSVFVDATAPVDNGADLQFIDTLDNDGDDLSISWTAFSDLTLTNHRIEIFSDSTCSTSVGTFLTGSSTNSDSAAVDGLNTGDYWATVTAIDGIGSETTSNCSTDTIRVDKDSPIDNGADLQFSAATDIDGNSIAVTWTAFSDPDGVVDHKLYTYTNNTCTLGETDHGATSSGTNSNATNITSLADGQYWAIVEAFDPGANSTKSACSTDSIIVDSTPPLDNTASVQFSATHENTGNNIAVSWTAFTDLTLSDHRLYTYTDSSCTLGMVDHGLTGSTTTSSSIITGLAEGTYYARVRAYDAMGFDTLSACSTDSIVIDKTAPVDNTADVQFTNDYNNTGDNVNVSWTDFSDTYLSDHRIYTYTDSACTLNEVDHGLTGSATSTNAAIIDGLSDGTYYIKVVAYDLAGNETTSACSTDAITIDTTAPTDNTANLIFADTHDIDGNDLNVSWTAFTDTNGIADYQVLTYTNSSCTLGTVTHPYIGSNALTDSTSIDGLADGTYFARVRAMDSAGNTTLSACSTDSIIVDSTPPQDNTANIQFTLTHENTGNNIAVTWTAFSDLTLSDHEVYTYTDSSCSLGEVNHGLTSSTAASANNITGLAEGIYYARVRAHDLMGFDTLSACSTDSIVIDKTPPTDNTANIQFTNDYNNTGNNIDLTWTGFTDTYLSDHRILTYTDAACSLNEVDHGLTGNTTVANNTIVDGLTDGVYYAKVVAIDLAGNTTESACSTDAITIDLINPTDNTADLQFADLYDNDGNDISVSWTAFTDLNSIADHQIYTYTDAACTLNETIHPLTGSGTNSDAVTIDGLTDNIYYAKVLAFDSAGNSTLSACSTDSIEVDTTPPTIGAREVVGTVVTGQPLGLFNLSDCNDVTHVKITKGLGAPPLAADSGWQTCDTVNYSMTFDDLDVGANNLQFWIKDVAENVQPSFIAHQVFFTPPQLTVENGPTINTTIADISIDYCTEAGITEVIFKDVDGQPAASDPDWQTCTTAIGGLKSYTLTPGDHTLKVYLKYEDTSISLNAIDLPLRYDPVINWVESPVINRPHVSFTFEACDGISEILINQGTQPAPGDPQWQTCSTSAGAITHTLTSDGEQTLNFWYKDLSSNVLTGYSQVNVNFVPPSAYLANGTDLDTNTAAISIDSCTDISKVYVKLDDTMELPPSVADFTTGDGQDCTTAMNAITSPIIPAEGIHTLDVWFYFNDGYTLDPWHERLTVRYTAVDSTPPPVSGGDGAAVPLAMTLNNGDASSPPILLDNASRAIFTLNTCEPNPPVAMTGTVDITASTTSVTGTGTLFTSEISVGDYINIGSEILKVASITNDTSLELVFPHTAGATGQSITKEYPDDVITDMIVTKSSTAPDADSPDWLTCSNSAELLKSASLTPDGVYTLYAWFKDASGNVSTTSLTQDVEVQANGDLTPPPRPEIIVEGAPEVASAPVGMTVVDCTDVDQIYLKPSEYPSPYVAPDKDQSGWQDCSEAVGALTYHVDLIGSYTISAWFKDAAGNINSTPRDVSFIFNPTQGAYPDAIAYWTMDNVHKKEGRIIDALGENHLVYWNNGSVTSTAGRSDEAVSLSGTNSYLLTKNTPILKPTTAVSVSMWANLTSGDTGNKVIMGNIEEGVGGYGFKLNGGDLRFYASGQSVSIATSSYTTGWHHIAGTSDGRFINIYIDGQLQATTDLGSPANLQYGCPTILAVGTDVNCTDQPIITSNFDGQLDELAIWDKYLSEQNILNLYIDTFNQFKVSQHSTKPADIASASFYGETLQNTKLTIDTCGDNKFIYIDETTHPPTVDTPRWQLCREVIGTAINKNLTQGPHELKVWGKDEYNNITNAFYYVDTVVTSTNHYEPSILHYTMDNDHIDGSLVQEIRSGYHATNNGATPSVSGVQNEAYQFVKASNTYLETKHAALSQVADEVTISIWAQLTANDNRQQVLAGNRISSHGYSIEIDNSTSELKFFVETSGGTRSVAIATSAYTTGFHNIVGVYDGQNTNLYIDGIQVASVDHGSVLPIQYTCLGSFVIGAGATCNNGAALGTHFDNKIDEVLVWDYSLTSAAITELFEGQDTVPPLSVPVTPRDNLYTIGIPVARLNVDNCSDIAKVYVALDDTKPTGEIANWQTCSTTDDLIKSSLLEIGANDLRVWFMDESGNVSDTSTDLTITYNFDATIPTPDSYYTLDRANRDGSVIYDVTSAHHGENYGPIESTGVADEAMSFNGTSDYIEVLNDVSFEPASEVTLSTWFNVDSFPTSRQVIAGNYNNGGYEIALDNGVVEFKVQALGGPQVATYSTTSLTPGDWTHVTGVWNNGTIRLFINGIEEVNTVIAGSADIDYAQSNSFLIGASPTTSTGPSGNYFDGSIDEVSFYRAALSDTVINELYERQSKGDKAYYDVTPPSIPVNLNIIYYNSLVSRANLTVTDCTGLDYIIVTKNEFPPDKNDEDWQLCNTLTGGLLSKRLDPTDNYAKFWTKDIYGNISKTFEYVPIITKYDKPIARPVVHWTFDEAHYNNTSNEALDRISGLKLKNEGYELEYVDFDNDTCPRTMVHNPALVPVTIDSDGVLNKSMLFGDDRFLRVKSPQNSKLKPSDTLSVAAWVYLTGDGVHSDDHIISNEFNGKGWSIKVDAANKDDKGLRFTVHTADGLLEPYLETKNYTTGWHLVIGTYDGQKASLYFDGIFVKSFSNASPSPIVYETGVNTFVGAKASTGDEPTNGKSHYYARSGLNCNLYNIEDSNFANKIDEVIIWDQVLTGLEASSLYHNGADILYETDVTEPPNPTLTLENTRPDLFSNKAYFTVNDCTDISGVLVNEGTRPDKQDDRWEVCRERRGSFGLEELTEGGHTITTWFKDLAGNVTSSSSDLVVNYTPIATVPYSNAYWPIESVASVDRTVIDIIEHGVHDLIEVNVDAADNPTATYTTGKVGEALSLTGSQSYLTTQDTVLLTPVNFLSVGGWFYLTQSDSTNRVYIDRHVYSTATNRGGYKLYQSGGNIRFTLELDIAGTINLASSMAGVTTGWNHVIGIFDDQEVKLYLNGVEIATSGVLPERDFVRYDVPTDFRIGAESNQNNLATNFLNEKVDEIAVWGYDLSPTEVATAHTKGQSSTRQVETMNAPSNVDNAYIYFDSHFGPYAKMTILNCTNTPWVYITYQGAPPPADDSDDWHRCVTNPGAILSEKLPTGTTYVDVYAKNALGDISTLAGTKEIDPIPTYSDYDLVKPIYHASFDNGTINGSTLTDHTSQVSAQLNGSPTISTSSNGNEVIFDGTDDYIDIANNFRFENLYNFTLMTWLHLDSTDTATRQIITKKNSKDDIRVYLDSGDIVFEVNIVQPSGYTRSVPYGIIRYPLELIQTGMHQLAVKYDGQELSLYIDANLVAQADPGYQNWSTTTIRKVDFDFVSGFYLGDNTQAENFQGALDDFMVFNQTLTDEEIFYHYKRYVDEVYPNDSTAPTTTPTLSVVNSTIGTNWPTDNPNPVYSINDCNDITGVYITVDAQPGPTNTSSGWQQCSTKDGAIDSPTLTPGVHTVYFWFRDARGNISSPQSIVVEYTDPPLPQPVAYWTLDQNTKIGSIFYDSSNAININNFGAQNIASAKVGNGLSFDGERQYLKTDYDPQLKVTDEFTIGFWMDHNIPTDEGSGDRFFSMTGAQPGGMEMYLICDEPSCATSNKFVDFKVNIGNRNYVLDLPVSQFPSSWVYVLYTYDGRYLRYYENGTLKREKDLNDFESVTYDAVEEVPFVMAAKAGADEQISKHSNMNIDDVAIWSKALNQSQITNLYNNYANNNTRNYDPLRPIVTPANTRASIYNPGYKSFGSRLRLTMNDCTDTDMILVSDSTVQPSDTDENWQVCNTIAGGILSSPLPTGSVTPRVWARSFTGEVSAASGTANDQSYTMPTYVSDIPRPSVHWSLDSAASGAYGHPQVYDNFGTAHGSLDATTPPESTATSGDNAVIEEGFSFNGIDEFIKIKPDANTNPMYTTSISAWAHLVKGETKHRHIAGNIQKATLTDGSGIGLRVKNGNLQFYVTARSPGSTGSIQTLTVDFDTSIYNTGLHHIVGTFNKQKLELYLDGVKVAEKYAQLFDGNYIEVVNDDFSYWNIGAETGYLQTAEVNSFFKGVIDDVMIWHNVLSEEEVYYLYEYGSDLLPTTLADGIAPTDPGIELTGNLTTTSSPWSHFTMPTCTGANGILINAIYVNSSSDAPPSKDDIGWQYCTRDEGYVISHLLERGDNDITVYFRDEEGDISGSTSFNVTYIPPDLIHPLAYYTFNTEDSISADHFRDLAGNLHIIASSDIPKVSSAIGGNAVESTLSSETISNTFTFEYDMERDFTISMWHLPQATSEYKLLEYGQLRISRTSLNQIQIHIPDIGTFTTNQSLIPAQWTHLTFRRENNSLKIYFNGKLISSFYTKTNNLKLHNSGKLSLLETRGRLDEVVIYDSPLTEDQIAYLFFKGSNQEKLELYPLNYVEPAVPDFYWNFNNTQLTSNSLSGVTNSESLNVKNAVTTGSVDAIEGEAFQFTRYEDILAGDDINTVGARQFLRSDSVAPIDFTSEFTLSMWIKQPNADSANIFTDDKSVIIDQWGSEFEERVFRLEYKHTSTGSGKYILYLRNGYETDITKQAIKVETTSFSGINGWHHLAIKRDVRKLAIFINGREYGAALIGTAAQIVNNNLTTPLRIGESGLSGLDLMAEDVSVAAGTNTITGIGSDFENKFYNHIHGSVDIISNTTVVTGTGTRFTQDLTVGESVLIAGEVHTIASITDNTTFILDANHSSGASGEKVRKVIPGTVSSTTGSNIITGVGTNFTSSQFPNNSYITFGNEIGQVASVDGPTQITLVNNAISTQSGVYAESTSDLKRLKLGAEIFDSYYVNDATTITLGSNHIAGVSNVNMWRTYNNTHSDEYGFDGSIDELAVWYDALDFNQIYKLYQKGLANEPISAAPTIAFNGVGNTTNDSTVSITLNDCQDYTHVWVGTSLDSDPLDGTPGWVACTDVAGGLTSPTLTSDSLNTVKIWFKTGSVVSSYTSSLDITHVTGDLTPPAIPAITLETASPTNLSYARFTIGSCSDIAGVLINLTGITPSAINPNWKNCSTINSALHSPILESGANTISVYFKDEAGNVTTSSDFALTYNPVMIAKPGLYLNYNNENLNNNIILEEINDDVFSPSVVLSLESSYIEGETIEFNGTRYLEDVSNTFNITSNFTISNWINIAKPTSFSVINDKWNSTIAEQSYRKLIDSNGRLCLEYQTVNSTQVWNNDSYKKICSTGKIEFGNWNHVAITRSGTNVNFYINSVNVGNETIDNGDLVNSPIPLRIGASQRETNGVGIVGGIDETAMWNQELSALDIETLYGRGMSQMPILYTSQPQATPLEDIFWGFESANYSAPNLSAAIGSKDLINVPSSTPSSATYNPSAQIGEAFDYANENYFETIDHEINLGTDFTISTWINLVDDSDDEGTILNKWNEADVDEQEFRLYTDNQYIKFSYHATTTATDTFPMLGFDTITSNGQIPLTTWTNIVITRRGNVIRMYINGELESYKVIGLEAMKNITTVPLRVGGVEDGGINFFTGTIDNTSIWKKPLTKEMIKYVYQQGQANLENPTTTQVSLANPSNTIVDPIAYMTISDCNGNTKYLIQDSSLGAPAAGALTNDCTSELRGIFSTDVPATSDTLHIYLGDGTSTVEGPYPVNVIYAP